VSEERLGAPNEKLRLCPSCRMSIPVLAVKCRFCGEEVGRPRDESRKLSISDLGGQDATMYAPSSSVMEALESFRTEEFTSAPPPEPQKRSLFGKKKPQTDTPRPARSDDMPELDENSQALASLSMPTRPRAKTYVPPEPTWMKKMGYLGAFIATILILYFGGVQVVAVINDWRRPPAAPLIPNRTHELIEQARSGDTVKFGDALAEAITVYSAQPTPSNASLLDEARKGAIAQVKDLLNADPWSSDKLDQASRLMAKGATDPDSNVRALDAERQQELVDYKNTVLRSLDQSSATFTVDVGAKVGEPRRFVKGDRVNDRFRIDEINPSKQTVTVTDVKRNNRKLTFVNGKSIVGSQK